MSEGSNGKCHNFPVLHDIVQCTCMYIIHSCICTLYVEKLNVIFEIGIQ